MILLFSQNIYFLERNNRILVEIDSTYNHKLDLVMSMSKVARERSLTVVTMFLSLNPWEVNKKFAEFHLSKITLSKLRAELEELQLVENEKIIFAEILQKLNKTESIQADIVKRINAGGDANVHADIAEQNLPHENEVLQDFNALVSIMRQNADKARNDAQQQYQQSIQIVLFFSGLIFIFSVVVMKRALSQIKNIESSLISDAESLSWDATHDALTNIYNRRWLQHKFDLLDADTVNQNINHTLLYLDLDEFKPINDNFGHVVGDNVLCGLTREFEKCIRQNDTLARMGGDEFAILLENCDANKASEIASCIIDRVDKYSLTVTDKSVRIAGVSIGVKQFAGDSAVFTDVIKQTDSACYVAKNAGKNQFHVFESWDITAQEK